MPAGLDAVCYNGFTMQLSYENVDWLCSKVDFRQPPPHIDLSEVSFIEPFALIYLGMFLRLHNANGIAFELTLPTSQKVIRYLAGQNFWERFNFDETTIEEERIHRFTTSTSLNDIVDIENRPYVGDDIAAAVCDLLIREEVKVDVYEIEYLVSEIVDNFERHSGTAHALAALAVQYYPKSKQLDIAIGDCGIGIRASLVQNPSHAYLADRPHYEAVRKALEPLISGRIQGGGMGLSEVKDSIKSLGGSLVLTSGDGYFSMSTDSEEYGLMYYDLPGVQISLTVPERG